MMFNELSNKMLTYQPKMSTTFVKALLNCPEKIHELKIMINNNRKYVFKFVHTIHTYLCFNGFNFNPIQCDNIYFSACININSQYLINNHIHSLLLSEF